ncbi:DUF2090 domain-containing protein [Curtobacterium flaccumfaciens]|nr:DUF2090 domain-containing protein [Curtobacterium flaccumfaciens]
MTERRPTGRRPERMPALDEAHPLFLFAMDQRSSLLEHTYDESGGEPVDEAEAERVRAGKQLVYRGVLSALAAGAARERTGVLVDERYGADVARLVKEAGLQLAMPVERSGREWFELEYGDDWEAHLDAFDPDWVKVLVRDNPDFDPAAVRSRRPTWRRWRPSCTTPDVPSSSSCSSRHRRPAGLRERLRP